MAPSDVRGLQASASSEHLGGARAGWVRTRRRRGSAGSSSCPAWGRMLPSHAWHMSGATGSGWQRFHCGPFPGSAAAARGGGVSSHTGGHGTCPHVRGAWQSVCGCVSSSVGAGKAHTTCCFSLLDPMSAARKWGSRVLGGGGLSVMGWAVLEAHGCWSQGSDGSQG